MSTFDDFLNDSSRIADRNQQLRRHAEDVERLAGDLSQARKKLANAYSMTANNLGRYHAVLAQLKKVDPNNPLVRDQALRSRIGEQAAAAFEKTNDFDAAREVGQTFSIPNR